VGTAAPALLIAVAALAAAPAHAETCTGVTATGGRFATCFDLGNRLSVTAGSNGFGGALAIRHLIRFDDEPDLVWKMEHTILEANHAGWEDRFSGTLYRGRFVRHARDGHILLPLGTPKKVFLPFDIGAEVTAGTIAWRPDSLARLGVVETALVFDFARTRSFTRRFQIGPLARWEFDVKRELALPSEHFIAPFSVGEANLRLESLNGLTVGELRVEAGTVWHSDSGWKPQARAEASLERILLAINDRPIAITMGARYDTETGEALARIGARIALYSHRDPRVSLDPPKTAPKSVEQTAEKN
jgi:hypothetical protein